MGNQRGRRRIADAHFAEADDIAAIGEPDCGLISAPRSMAIRALLGGHRRLFDVIGRAQRHLGVDQPGAARNHALRRHR
jgi:hypothetical protein